jgi:hypothetical protein
MTKKEAYEKYNLDMGSINFNPDEEADEQFIAGCRAMFKARREIAYKQIKCIFDDVDNHLGPLANDFKCAVMGKMLYELVEDDKISDDLAAFILALLLDDCPIEVIIKALGTVGDIFDELEEE